MGDDSFVRFELKNDFVGKEIPKQDEFVEKMTNFDDLFNTGKKLNLDIGIHGEESIKKKAVTSSTTTDSIFQVEKKDKYYDERTVQQQLEDLKNLSTGTVSKEGYGGHLNFDYKINGWDYSSIDDGKDEIPNIDPYPDSVFEKPKLNADGELSVFSNSVYTKR
jgi:hypothetical protein